jgi:UDP-3-O-[3-hydroxymyristoyl] glucosamine N-acyltransferase
MGKTAEQTVLTVSEFAEGIGAEIFGDSRLRVTAVNSVESARRTEVCFVSSARHVDNLAASKAGAVIVSEKVDGIDITQLLVSDVDVALIKALHLFAPKLTVTGGIHPAAVVEKTAVIGKNVAIGPGAYISGNVTIGPETTISAGCIIGENTTIGSNCRLDGNVVVYHNCQIGDNCVILANTAIGSTGYGYKFIDGQHRRIPHNGGVVIEDCVDIGANCCVDRAKFGNTVIGAGTKIDNLVQIGHNCIIGKCCLLAGQVGLSGSCRLDDGAILAGQAGISDHVAIGAQSMIGGGAAVIHDVPAGKKVWGSPAIDFMDYARIYAVTKRLPQMAKQLKKVTRKVEKLEASKNNS